MEPFIRGRISLLIWIVSALASLQGYAHAQSIERETPVLAETLAKQLVERKRTKVAALDFTDIQGRPNELGRFLAEQLSVDLVSAPGITVIDRANLNAIMAEHKLTAEGLVDPENAKRLGRFAGVDAILIGNLAPIDASVMLTIRAVSTETAELVAAGRIRFDMTNDVRRMLGLSVSSSATAVPRTDVNGNVEAPAATAAVGPVTVVVKNVVLGFAGDGSARVPEIRMTFDLENRDLNVFAAVAANTRVIPDDSRPKAPVTDAIYAGLQEIAGGKWSILAGGLKGVPSVYCFEVIEISLSGRVTRSSPRAITHNSPSNIVDYIRRGIEYDGGAVPDHTQRMWSGSFASIEPGGRLEMTAVFVPSTVLSGRGGVGGLIESILSPASSGIQGTTWPDSVELSLELVTATHRRDESPDKAQDLALRNLVFGRLVLPKSRPPM